MYGSRSPYRSPMGLPNEIQQQGPGQYPPFNAFPMQQSSMPTTPTQQPSEILPGSITYTTTTAPDGRPVYQPFKAVPATYQTPNGAVSGIQWMPIEATAVVPAGAQPATAEFAAMWQRGGPGMTSQDEQKIKDWQKAEDKRRRKEEKESKRALRDKDFYNNTHSPSTEDAELRKAREKDARRAADRERRRSFNGGQSPYRSSTAQGTHSNPGTPFIPPGSASTMPYAQPTGMAPTYSQQAATSPYAGHPFPGSAAPSPGSYPPSARGGQVTDLDRQMGEMDLSAAREFEREKPPMSRPMKYATAESMKADRARRMSGNFGPSPYAPPAVLPAHSDHHLGGNLGAGAHNQPYPTVAPQPTTSPYPAFGQPGPTAPYTSFQNTSQPDLTNVARSRATTPAIGAANLPQVGATGYPGQPGAQHQEVQQLPAPEGFSRPPSQTLPYTPFEMIKIQDMEDFLENVPRLPAVLQTHDTFHEDWIRLMQDLALAWAGRLPIPELVQTGQYPKRAELTATVLALWNQNFFMPRGVEVVLYKGRERRSGPQAGVVDLEFQDDDDDDDSDDSTTTSSEDENESGGEGTYGLNGGLYGNYGRHSYAPNPEVLEARRRRKERKIEKKRRRKEKKQRRKARAREKKYALYLTCIQPAAPVGVVGGYGAHGGPFHGGPYR